MRIAISPPVAAHAGGESSSWIDQLPRKLRKKEAPEEVWRRTALVQPGVAI
jgi:hypothetical protein